MLLISLKKNVKIMLDIAMKFFIAKVKWIFWRSQTNWSQKQVNEHDGWTLTVWLRDHVKKKKKGGGKKEKAAPFLFLFS